MERLWALRPRSSWMPASWFRMLFSSISSRIAWPRTMSRAAGCWTASPGPCPRQRHWIRSCPLWARRSMSFLNIDVPDAELVKRVTGRRMCKCGATYHVQFNKPKVEGKCDACGGDLYQRADDTEATVKQRLKAYHAQTQPLIDYYNKRGHRRHRPRCGRYQGHLRRGRQGSGQI